MRSNIYDVDETIIVVGSCLKNMQPQGLGGSGTLSKVPSLRGHA